MRKILLNFILVTAVLLAACGQASPTPDQAGQANPAGQVTAALPPTPSLPPVGLKQPTATKKAPAPTAETTSAVMECQVVSMSPTQGPTEESMFPPPTADDWVLGKNPKAPLTITEYSDFQ